jgi:hypothetical protein
MSLISYMELTTVQAGEIVQAGLNATPVGSLAPLSYLISYQLLSEEALEIAKKSLALRWRNGSIIISIT